MEKIVDKILETIQEIVDHSLKQRNNRSTEGDCMYLSNETNKFKIRCRKISKNLDKVEDKFKENDDTKDLEENNDFIAHPQSFDIMNNQKTFAKDVLHVTEHQKALAETCIAEDPRNSETKVEGEGQSMRSDVEMQEHHVPEEEIPGQSSLQKNKKRRCDESTLEKNVIKKPRYNCLPCKTKSGNELVKQTKPINCTKCRYKCSANFSEEERTAICTWYWNSLDYQSQKDFILKSIKSNTPRTRKSDDPSKQRKISRSYFFQKDDTEVRVCQSFYEKTLSISNGSINAIFSGSSNGIFNAGDNGGKKTPPNKSEEEDLALVRSHIETFPAVESHYCRKVSNTKYLDAKLSITKMFQLYEIKCAEDNKKPVSLSIYRSVFCKEYNLSFFVKSRKDQCTLCDKYNDLKKNGILTAEITKAFEDYHIHKKTEAQEPYFLLRNERQNNDDTHDNDIVTTRRIISRGQHSLCKSLPEGSNKRDCMSESGVDDDED